jgi:hypothetical protein
MRSLRQSAWLRSVWLGAALLWCVDCRSERDRFVARDVLAWPLAQLPLRVAGHAALELDAGNPLHGADPVLHLWDVDAHAEVARAGGAGMLARALGRPAQIRYRNPHAQARNYVLFVRARDARSRGEVDVYRDGRLLAAHAAVGGSFVALSAAAQIVYRVASTPAGPRAALLMALAGDGALLALDEHSGVTSLPSLQSSSQVASLLLAPLGAAAGRFAVYANDADDRDGDGLGRRLERALGTCDAPSDRACRTSPLAAYYQQVGTRDSDRDGLSDADELFGVHAPELDLPRFGVDPRHKDVLVEVDHHASLDSVGFSEQDFAEIATLFAQGDARDLKNPDGRPGLRVHFDAGFEPREPAHSTLLGDFAGSGRADAREYRAARRRDFTPSRAGYFRYAFSTQQGRGQATQDAFTVNRDLQRVTIFAHELGHTLGLAHYGHEAWGRANCKPNYYSIMNYLYQNHYEIGFSRRATRTLNPAAVVERAALAARDPGRLLREPPLELDVWGRDVDWNRDGMISDAAVRADLFWATYKSCGAAEHGLVTLAETGVLAATPVLVEIGDHLHALWLSDAGALFGRQRRMQGACAADAAADGCNDWSPAQAVAGLASVRFIAGLALPDTRLALAYVSASEALHVAELQFGANGWRVESDRELAARTQHAPSLTWMSVDARHYGATRLLSVFFRAAGEQGELWQASALGPRGPFVLRRLFDAQQRPLASALGPSSMALPTGELCGVFPDREGFMRFYGYAKARDVWVDLSARAFDIGLGPRTWGSANLAFHRYRDASGALIAGDATRGALYITFSEPESSAAHYPDNPHFFVSEWLNAQHGVFEQISLRWRGRVISEWTNLAPGTSMALLEHDAQSQLAGLMAVRNEATHTTHLDFLPSADGVFDETLAGGDDFQVMERGVCMGLRSERECGDASTAAY